MATDKAGILAALENIDPPPRDLINELKAVEDVRSINRKIKMWMGFTKDDWLSRRPNDGDDIYNALHPTNQGVKHKAKEDLDPNLEKRIANLEKYLKPDNTISMSSLDQDVIIAEGFTVEGWSLLSCTDDIVNLDLFEWDERKECAQHDKYIPYLSALLKHGEFLSVTVPPNNKMLDNKSLRIHLKGTTAAVIRPVGCLEEVICIGELKKVVNESHRPQLHGELISVNSKYPGLKPFGVLSDLRDCWIICWIDGNIICQVSHEFTTEGRLVPLTRNTAIAFMRHCSLAAISGAGERTLELLAGRNDEDVVSKFANRKAIVVKVEETGRFVSFQEFKEQEELKESRTLDSLNGKVNFDAVPVHLDSKHHVDNGEDEMGESSSD